MRCFASMHRCESDIIVLHHTSFVLLEPCRTLTRDPPWILAYLFPTEGAVCEAHLTFFLHPPPALICLYHNFILNGAQTVRPIWNRFNPFEPDRSAGDAESAQSADTIFLSQTPTCSTNSHRHRCFPPPPSPPRSAHHPQPPSSDLPNPPSLPSKNASNSPPRPRPSPRRLRRDRDQRPPNRLVHRLRLRAGGKVHRPGAVGHAGAALC